MYEALQQIGIFLCCRIVVRHEWLALIWIHLKTSFSYFIFSDCNLFQITATWVTWQMPTLHCSINHSKDILINTKVWLSGYKPFTNIANVLVVINYFPSLILSIIVYFVISHNTGTFIDTIFLKISDFNAASLRKLVEFLMKLLFYTRAIVWEQKSSRSSAMFDMLCNT